MTIFEIVAREGTGRSAPGGVAACDHGLAVPRRLFRAPNRKAVHHNGDIRVNRP